MKLTYKFIKTLHPHCGVCGEILTGNNSLVLPYKCKCGTWKRDYPSLDFKLTAVNP
jgi:hypothetical protein